MKTLLPLLITLVISCHHLSAQENFRWYRYLHPNWGFPTTIYGDNGELYLHTKSMYNDPLPVSVSGDSLVPHSYDASPHGPFSQVILGLKPDGNLFFQLLIKNAYKINTIKVTADGGMWIMGLGSPDKLTIGQYVLDQLYPVSNYYSPLPFLIRINSQGEVTWATQFPYYFNPSLAIDAEGNAIVSLYSMGTAGDIEVQVGNVTMKNQSRTALLAKYAPNGSVIWTRPYYLSYEPPLGEPFTIQLEAGPGEDLYMYGTPFLGISDVSPAPEISIWGQYSYVTRLTRDGDIRWTALTPFMGRSPYHLLVSPTGDSYLANYAFSSSAYHISPNGAQVTQIPHQSGYEPFLMEDTALYIGYGSRLNISCALGGETLAGAYHLGRITGGVLADSTTVLSYGTYHSLQGVNEYGFLVFAPGYVSVTSNGLDRLATSIHAEQLLLNDTRLITGDYNIVGELTYPFIPVSDTLQPVCYTSPNGWSTTYKDWILLAPVPADQYVEVRIIIQDTPYFKTNQVPDPAIPMQLSLYDISMREQVRDIFTSEDPVITRTLDVSNLTPGVYILTLTRGGIRTWSGKLYVRH